MVTADSTKVFHIVDQLTDAEKDALLNYLQQKQSKTKPCQHRHVDLHPGAINIADDFNNELPDRFWIGEE